MPEEVKVFIDLSAMHPDNFPRTQRALQLSKKSWRYVVNVTDAVSRLINVILGGNGADTLSSQAFRTERPFWELLRKWLNVIFSPRTRTHCQKVHWRCLERSKALLANR